MDRTEVASLSAGDFITLYRSGNVEELEILEVLRPYSSKVKSASLKVADRCDEETLALLKESNSPRPSKNVTACADCDLGRVYNNGARFNGCVVEKPTEVSIYPVPSNEDAVILDDGGAVDISESVTKEADLEDTD